MGDINVWPNQNKEKIELKLETMNKERVFLLLLFLFKFYKMLWNIHYMIKMSTHFMCIPSTDISYSSCLYSFTRLRKNRTDNLLLCQLSCSHLLSKSCGVCCFCFGVAQIKFKLEHTKTRECEPIMQIFSCPSVCPIFCLWNNKNDLHIGQLLHDIHGLRTRCKYTKKCELKFQYLV